MHIHHYKLIACYLIISIIFIGCVSITGTLPELQPSPTPQKPPKITSEYPKYHKDGKIEVGKNIFFYTSFGSAGKNFTQFNNPQDMAMDKDGYLYVADTGNHRIQKFTSNGDFAGVVGTNTQFISPSSLSIDNEGKMYLIDTGNLIKLSPQGEILRTIRINDPKGVAVEGDELYVTSGDKILCFDAGLLNLKWSLSDHREWNPFGIAVKQGYIYVTDIKNNCICRILRREKSSSWVCSVAGGLNNPLGIAVDDNCVFVVDTNNHNLWLFEKEIQEIRKFGNQGNSIGEFNNPSGIAVKGNRIYVLDTGNCRIQVFDRIVPESKNSLNDIPCLSVVVSLKG